MQLEHFGLRGGHFLILFLQPIELKSQPLQIHPPILLIQPPDMLTFPFPNPLQYPHIPIFPTLLKTGNLIRTYIIISPRIPKYCALH